MVETGEISSPFVRVACLHDGSKYWLVFHVPSNKNHVSARHQPICYFKSQYHPVLPVPANVSVAIAANCNSLYEKDLNAVFKSVLALAYIACSDQ